MKLLFYRIISFLHHHLTARHTMGYSIHSPSLFYLAREILPETKPYYCFERIELLRRQLLASSEEVTVKDWGTGRSGQRKVSDIARSSLKPAREAQLLMRLGVVLQAKNVLELGTSLGLTTAYLASVGAGTKVTTFEGAPELCRLAKQNWAHLGISSVVQQEGNIDELLPQWAEAHKGEQLDFAFLDANHRKKATLHYFEELLPLFADKSVCVVDDIHHSPEMQEAWETLCGHPKVTGAFDLYSMGWLFFDPHLEKRVYKIRI